MPKDQQIGAGTGACAAGGDAVGSGVPPPIAPPLIAPLPLLQLQRRAAAAVAANTLFRGIYQRVDVIVAHDHGLPQSIVFNTTVRETTAAGDSAAFDQ